MPKLGAEQTAVQDPMIRYAQDVGWESLSPTQVESLRGNRDRLRGYMLDEGLMNVLDVKTVGA